MAADTTGKGRYTYRLEENWARLPQGETLGLVSSGACDSTDRVFICQRKDPPIRAFDIEGKLIDSWGDATFKRPHGLSISNDIFGSVHINEASSARVDVMPFGGVKDSGFGKEGPAYAVRELTEERLISIGWMPSGTPASS